MEELYNNIDDYLQGALSPEQRETLEARMKEDPEFAKQVAEQQALRDGITAVGQTRLKAELQAMHQDLFGQEESFPPTAKIRPFKWRYVAAAASIAIVAIASYWIFFSGPNYEQLYASNFEPYAVNFVNRTNDTDPQTLKIQDQYQQQDYANALPGLEQLATTQPQQQRIQLALGIAYLAENRPQQAVSTLSKIEDPLVRNTAQWYLALAYIRQKEKQRAIPILRSIAADKGADYQQQATTLLQELD